MLFEVFLCFFRSAFDDSIWSHVTVVAESSAPEDARLGKAVCADPRFECCGVARQRTRLAGVNANVNKCVHYYYFFMTTDIPCSYVKLFY
jgi:23S rRNA G2445 N2-methylase RlmL